MDLTIKTSNNQPILLVPGLPSREFFSSSEIKVWIASTTFGDIRYEERLAGGFILRSVFVKLFRKMTLYFHMNDPKVGVRIAVQNKWNFGVPGSDAVQLNKNQFVIYYAGKKGERIVFEKDKEYRSFEVLCPPEKLADLMALFPRIHAFTEHAHSGKSAFLNKRPVFAPYKALDILNKKPDFTTPYLPGLFYTLLLEGLHEESEELPETRESEAALAARDLIMANLADHHTISEIAKKVDINEYRLKYVFKRTYGTGMFEYLQKARMTEARRLLLETDLSFDEIGKRIGYQHLTNFIHAFGRFYKYPPSAVRKTKSSS